ncbi:MAG: hypothetical protein R2856_06865 [Caldilineaceae bacterium]
MADLSVSKVNPQASPWAAAPYVCTVTVTNNNGPSDAASVVVTDALPAQVNFVSAVGATCASNNGVVTCDPVNLAAGGCSRSGDHRRRLRRCLLP